MRRLNDINGILRGLYVIQQHANTGYPHRPIVPERFVRRATDVDRANYQMKVEEEAFAAKLKQEE